MQPRRRSHYNAFRSITSQTCTYIRTWQHQMTTIMQPFQCDLQPQIPKHPTTTHTHTHKHTQSSLKPPLQCGQKKKANRPQPHPPHRRGTFHRRLQPLYTEKPQGFVLWLRPQNKAHATLMQPLQCVSQHHVANLHVYTHMATPDDNNHVASPMRSATTDSKTPYNYAHTHTQAHPYNAAKKKGKPTAAASAAQTRYLSSSAAATLHGKTQGFVLRLPPQHKTHATLRQPLQCVSQHHVANLHVYTHMATPDDSNHAAIPLRSAATDSKTPYNYAHTHTQAHPKQLEATVTMGPKKSAIAEKRRF